MNVLPHVSCVRMLGNEATGYFAFFHVYLKLFLVGSLIPRLTYWLFVVIGTAAFEKFSAGLSEGPESGGEVVSAGQCHIMQ